MSDQDQRPRRCVGKDLGQLQGTVKRMQSLHSTSIDSQLDWTSSAGRTPLIQTEYSAAVTPICCQLRPVFISC